MQQNETIIKNLLKEKETDMTFQTFHGQKRLHECLIQVWGGGHGILILEPPGDLAVRYRWEGGHGTLEPLGELAVRYRWGGVMGL